MKYRCKKLNNNNNYYYYYSNQYVIINVQAQQHKCQLRSQHKNHANTNKRNRQNKNSMAAAGKINNMNYVLGQNP